MLCAKCFWTRVGILGHFLKQIRHMRSVGPDEMQPRVPIRLIYVIILLSVSTLEHCGDWGGSW